MMYLILLIVGLGVGFFFHDMIVAKLGAVKAAILAKL